jgi:hypothetical protein
VIVVKKSASRADLFVEGHARQIPCGRGQQAAKIRPTSARYTTSGGIPFFIGLREETNLPDAP